MRAGRFSGWLVRGWAAWTARSRLFRVLVALAVVTPLIGVGHWVLAGHARPPAAKGVAVKGVHDVHFEKTATAKQPPSVKPPKETWPAVTTADVSLDPAKLSVRNPGAGQAPAKGTPVWVQPVKSPSGAYTGPAKVTVKTAARDTAKRLNITGLVFTATPHGGTPVTKGAGPVRIGVDYNWLTAYYGRNWATSLHMVQLPACALTSPDKTECRTQTSLPGAGIYVKGQDVYAQPTALSVNGTATVLAVTSGTGPNGTTTGGADGGAAGSSNSTDLKPSGSWTAGGSRGSFTYSYPIPVPSVATVLAPQLGLNYDSGSVDGQTSATSSQANWLGDGWSTPNSFIEQTFAGCADKPEGAAAPKKIGDLCYDGPILSMSLNGRTVDIIAQNGKYTTSDASGEKVERVTNANNGTGADNKDFWRITGRDGTQYYFGRNQLPGWTSGKQATNSVDWEPVFSAHQPNGTTYTDPCWKSEGFDKSVCKTAYRWHLDYVVDVRGNATSYYYKQATNSYTQNAPLTTTDPATIKANADYVRDSYLDHIDYGFRDGQAYSVNSGHAPAQVIFKSSPRCLSGSCDFPTGTSRNGYLDTPNDLICKVGDRCLVSAPTHWSTVRLTGIATQQWDGSAYAPVDSWTFTQTMPDPNDGADPTLWLSSISRKGADTAGGGSAVTLPDVTFEPQTLPNRVDAGTDGNGPLNRMRLLSITTETGSVIGVNYFQANPCPTPSSIDPAKNTTSCFPVYWTPPYSSKPFRDWFNTYQVKSVTQTSAIGTDPTGRSPATYTGYSYLGGGAWHFDTNEVVKPKYRTYGQWRGFGKVQTFMGQGSDPQTESETVYYRGMANNNITNAAFDDNEGGWSVVDADKPITFTGDSSITDSQGKDHPDLDRLAGSPLETTTYNWAGGNDNITGSTINSYWVSPAIASRPRNALPDLTVNATGQVETWTRQKVSGTPGWRITETDTAYDTTATSPTFGMPVRVYEHGDTSRTDQRKCTTTSYAPYNSGNNLAGLPAEVVTIAKACGGANPDGASVPASGQVNALTAPSSYNAATELVSDTKTIYDDDTLGPSLPTDLDPGSTGHPLKTPVVGNVTEVRKADYDVAAGKVVWKVAAATKYDDSGVSTDTWNALGAHTHTENTVTAGVVTKTVTTNPLGQTATIVLDPRRSVPISTSDPNKITTSSTYDGLGRLTAVWSNSRPTSQPANVKYGYQLSRTAVSAVTTQTANDANGYSLSTALYDAMLRPVQTQSPTPQGGRLLTNTFYDTHGWTWKSNAAYWDSGATPNNTLAAAEDSKIPSQIVTTFDGAGRPILATSYYQSQVREQTATAYYGDKTITVPPPGGVATQSVTDALGRSIEADNYTSRPNVTINPGTGPAAIPSVTISGGSTTASNGKTQGVTYGYDARGNQTDIKNLASGDVWHSDYGTLGQVLTKTDPDAGKTSTSYDLLGRIVQSTDGNGATTSYTYDVVDRRTGSYHGAAPTSGQPDATKQIASWTYDNLKPDGSADIAGLTNPIGHLTSSTRYDVNGSATVGGLTGKQRGYTTHVTDGFTVFGDPLGSTTTLPASEGALKGDHTVYYDYTDRAGLLLDAYYNADGPLPEEQVDYGWKTAGGLDLQSGSNGLGGYASDVTYSAYSQVTQVKSGASSKPAYLSLHYDEHTGRLDDQQFTYSDRSSVPIDQNLYSYDLAGNPTKQINVRQGSQRETQCFGYDSLDRLTQAWTGTDDCKADPASNGGATVGSGIANGAYWTSWTFDPLGQRQKQTDHGVGGTGDMVTSYTYAGSGNAQPHTLTSLTKTTAATPGATPVTVQTQSFGYDKVGNLNQRSTITNPNQPNSTTDSRTLGWDDQGELSTVTTSQGGVSYLYGPDGQLLLQKDASAKVTTLYLPGEQLSLNTATGILSGVRYYPQPGGVTAVRAVDAGGIQKVSFTTSDPHGTGTFNIDKDWAQPVWKQSTPYGDSRGTKPSSWPDNHGFLDKVEDQTTGLVNVGARWYDPTLGRFISVDPILSATGQQQQNGYTYADSNPVTSSDPSGLCPIDRCGGGIVNVGHDKPAKGGCGLDCGRPGIRNPTRDAIRNVISDLGDPRKRDNGNPPGPIVADPVVILSGLSGFRHRQEVSASVKAYGFGLDTSQGPDLGNPLDTKDSSFVNFFNALIGDAMYECSTGSNRWRACLMVIATVISFAGGGKGAEAGEGITIRGGKLSSGGLRGAKCSFLPETPVLLPDGKSKSIKEVKKGELVANTVPGDIAPAQRHRVSGVAVTPRDTRFTKVTIATKHGPQSVTGTSSHLYWDATKNAWTAADQLKAGDFLQGMNGRLVKIISLQELDFPARTYNLAVEQLHTYYVLAGKVSILVHNCPDLVADDAHFPAAHTLNEHVNVTDQDLINMARQSGIKSRFTDLQTAQQVVDYGIADNQRRIATWLRRGGVGPLEIKGRFGANNSIGVRADADGAITPTSNAYTIILQRAAGHPGGYYVSTAYPR
ncbi:RNase A-like domain-containing protein [Actinomadura parmotrematis]|uniref:Bacterial CdiA-CT RNAse A domain-containing protein n=1 Tax=Actinomadura parmotrematis TaxID=2864039 RepID=A0ABS7FVH5_9ACTN|nr:RNase A-like domain-containing protein [Actinomadura parmotrematis]MBW8484423.1 hypothetical protein [Actinomadura parmotrematis]